MNKFTERAATSAAIPLADIGTAPVTGVYVPVANYRRFYAAIMSATVAQTKSVTLQFMQAQDASGTGAKVLGTAKTVTAPSGGAKLLVESENYVENLDTNNGFNHIAVRASSDAGAALNGAAILIRDIGRFSQ